MTKKINFSAVLCAVVAFAGVGVPRLSAYVFLDNRSLSTAYKWQTSTVTFNTDFPAPGETPMIDKSEKFDTPFTTALAAWDSYIYPVGFTSRASTAASKTLGNGVNVAWFSDTMYGEEFDNGVLAVCYTLRKIEDTKYLITEAKIIFNTSYTWNSYRGNLRSGIRDFQRVALHELGHGVGFGHPNEYRQTVTAIMNSTISNIDELQEDERAGAEALYGAKVKTGVPVGKAAPKYGPRGLGEISSKSSGGQGRATTENPKKASALADEPFSIVLEGALDKKLLIEVDKPLYNLVGRVGGDVKTRFMEYSTDGGVTWTFMPGFNPVDKTFRFYTGMPAKGETQTYLIRAAGPLNEYSGIRTVLFYRNP